MAGKRGRAKKSEPVAVEAADSTSIEDQTEQNGDSNEVVEKIKVTAPPRKGGRLKKEIVEKVIEEKPIKAIPAKKAGKGKRETNGITEELNGEIDAIKEDSEILNKKGKPKREVNSSSPIKKVEETQMLVKKGRGKKGETIEPMNVPTEEKIEEVEVKDKKKKASSVQPVKKSGRKRAAETPVIENDNENEPEVIDSKKQKKEKETNIKEVSIEKESTKISPVKAGRGRKKKEIEEPSESTTAIVDDKAPKVGRGKKRSKVEETSNEGVDNLESEQKAVEPVPKKEKKTKATVKSTTKLDSEKIIKTKKVAEKKPKANTTETIYDPKDFVFDQEFNLKISSWNVAGLRSWINKDGLKFIQHENPDIFCLQETKCSEDMIPDEARIPGYHPYWHCKPGGYAGVAIYSKKMPFNIEYGIGDEEQDADGRIMTAEYEKFYLVNVYVPNAGRKLVTLPKRMRWDELLQNYVIKLNKKKPVIICGDMNVSHNEIDLANPKTNKKNAGFTQEERDGMTKLLALGFIDTFRHFWPDKTGAYTFWTYMMNARAKNVGWRLDYFLVSEKLIKKVVNNVIRSSVMGSDHCPITLLLNI